MNDLAAITDDALRGVQGISAEKIHVLVVHECPGR